MNSDQNMIEVAVTAGAMLAGVVLMALIAWLERRPRQSINPALIPTTPLMFAGACISLVALVHMVNLYGVHTGR